MNKDIVSVKVQDDDLELVFSAEALVDNEHDSQLDIDEIDNQLSAVFDQISELDSDINKLTNHADKFDYMIAIGSGIIAGIIDAVWVGAFDFDALKVDSNKFVNQFITKYAQKRGYEGERLGGAIEFLEKKFPVDQDNIWKGRDISSTKLHHLEDMAHHPTLFGLAASILVHFLRVAIFVDKNGTWHWVGVPTDKKEVLKIWLPIAITGLLHWLVSIAEKKYKEEKLKELPKPIRVLLRLLASTPAVIEVLKVTDKWFGHLVSDMGGSKNTAGGGMGIPGLFISLLKEMSSIPPLNYTSLPKKVSDLYSKDKWDLRNELAIVEHLGKQAVPVIVNECLVRCFYFVRNLITEKKKQESWKDVDWDQVVPWDNRTINRMLTISTSTFTAFDVIDAAVESGGFNPKMLLRINFVGIGRCAFSIGTDIYMGVKKGKKERERMLLYSQATHLKNAKLCYKQADMWKEAETAEEIVEQTSAIASQSLSFLKESVSEIMENIEETSKLKDDIEAHNPGLLDDIAQQL